MDNAVCAVGGILRKDGLLRNAYGKGFTAKSRTTPPSICPKGIDRRGRRE